MPHRTLFAGLAAPDPGESTQVLGGDFIYHNPDLTDQFLRIGALTHRHDAHTPLRDPFVPLTVTPIASAGAGLPGGTAFYFTYTLTDKQGGETLPAQTASAFTGGQVLPPSAALRATPDYTAGIMPDGQYAYGETFTDGAGGETTIGPTTWTFVDPGFASAQVILALDAPPTGAVSRRLWRSYEGADWHLVTEISAAASSFVDAGFDPPDNPARPPQTNTTASNSVALELQIPDFTAEAAVGSATYINIYMAEDLPTFGNPSLLQTVPAGLAGSAIIVTSFSVTAGEPPAVSTSVPGAALINPDTDILDWHWKRPVSTSTALPSGSTGDVRMTLDSGHLWGVLNPSGAVGSAASAAWTDLFTIVPDNDAQYLTSFLTSASGGASARVSGMLEFTGSGIATVAVQDLGGGSGVVRLTVPPPPSPQLPGVGGSGAVPLIAPAYYVQFIGINGATVSVTGQGGGSAQVTVDTSIATASSSTGVAASGGLGRVAPVRELQFGASGGVNVAVQDLGGGSARVVIGAPGSVPKATQASGYAFGVNDPGTVVESASAGNGSAMTAFYINPNAQTPIPLDSVIEVFQYGTGQVMIVGSGGVLLRSDGNKTKTAAQFATIGLRQRAIDEWVLSGDLTS